MNLTKLQQLGDREIKLIDRNAGITAYYKIPTGSTIDIAAGTNTIIYDNGGDPATVKVRSKSLSVMEKNAIRDSGIANFDAVWFMRKFYVNEVKPGHVLQVSGMNYEVVMDGASLDDLQILWTIITRRRLA